MNENAGLIRLLMAEDDLRHQLAGPLILLHEEGVCRCCGLVLTGKDRDRGKQTYTCPRCGRSGKAGPIVAKSSSPEKERFASSFWARR